MPRKVSTDDRLRARELFSQGLTLSEISRQMDGRVSPGWISTTARAEGWVKALVPPDKLADGQDQIYESASATAEEMNANTEKMAAAALRRWQQQKEHLAAKLGAGAERIFEQMFAQHVLKEVKTVGMGGGVQDLRMVEVVLTEPTPADKKHLATTLAILVDKASLLSGDATSRVETSALTGAQVKDRLVHYRDEVAKRRADKEIAAAQAAGKKATG